MNWPVVDEIIRAALAEDLGFGDITTSLLPDPKQYSIAEFYAKESGVMCGGEVAGRCFEAIDSDIDAVMAIAEGVEFQPGTLLGSVCGRASTILAGERVSLNFLQRLCGIATQARRLAERAAQHGIRITETRKTTPGLRILEKYAVKTGGGFNHRMDLSHCVMFKDNHFALAETSPEELVRAAKKRVGHTMKVIAEAANPQMVEPLVAAGADVVLLDNFTPEQVKDAVSQVAGCALIEVSGGINADNLDQYLIPGVDVISLGALTHSYRALDISLELHKD